MFTKAKLVANIVKVLPIFERLAFHMANIFGQRERFYIKIYGANAKELVLLWGSVQYRRGQQVQIELRCTSRALAVIHKTMIKDSVQFQSRLVSK